MRDSGFSPRLRADVDELEHDRNYLWPTAVESSFRRWAHSVREPYRRLWDRGVDGCGVWNCCGDPYEARELLDFVARALPRKSARELRERLEPLDDLY